MVVVYSNFSSVQSSKISENMGLEFIGAINQASHKFPMSLLQRKECTYRGDNYSLLSEEVNEVVSAMMVFVL